MFLQSDFTLSALYAHFSCYTPGCAYATPDGTDQRHVLQHLVVYLMALAFSFLVQRVPTYSSRGSIGNLNVKVAYPSLRKDEWNCWEYPGPAGRKTIFFCPFEWATADAVAVCHSFSLIHTAVFYVWRFTVLSSSAPGIGVYSSLRARGACSLQGCWLLSLLTWLTVIIILFTRGTGQNWAAKVVTG
jgi:hypothetical protein